MKLFEIGWRDITPQEAADLGLEQPGRWKWQLWGIGFLGFGVSFWARARP